MHRAHGMLVGAAFAGLCATAHADLLFGVDVLSDSLVQINTNSGAVTVVGSLRRLNATNIELAWSGDSLYAVNTTFGLGAELVEINVHNGAASRNPASIMLDGQPAVSVEGLAADPVTGQLWASFRTGQGQVWQANGLGMLALDGTISGAVDTMAVNPIADWDALEIMQPGEFLGGDARSDGSDVVELHRVTLSPLASGLRRSFSVSDAFGSLNDLAWNGEHLFGVDTSVGQIVQLDPVTLEIIASTPYDDAYAIVGIAPFGVPAPGGAGLIAVVAFGATRRRR